MSFGVPYCALNDRCTDTCLMDVAKNPIYHHKIGASCQNVLHLSYPVPKQEWVLVISVHYLISIANH